MGLALVLALSMALVPAQLAEAANVAWSGIATPAATLATGLTSADCEVGPIAITPNGGTLFAAVNCESTITGVGTANTFTFGSAADVLTLTAGTAGATGSWTATPAVGAVGGTATIVGTSFNATPGQTVILTGAGVATTGTWIIATGTVAAAITANVSGIATVTPGTPWAVLQSVDGGHNWTATGLINNAGPITGIAVSSNFATDGTMYVAAWSGTLPAPAVFRSNNSGTTFTELKGVPPDPNGWPTTVITSIDMWPASPYPYVMVGTDTDVWVLQDAPLGVWMDQEVNAVAPVPITDVAFAPDFATTNYIWAVTSAGVVSATNSPGAWGTILANTPALAAVVSACIDFPDDYSSTTAPYLWVGLNSGQIAPAVPDGGVWRVRGLPPPFPSLAIVQLGGLNVGIDVRSIAVSGGMAAATILAGLEAPAPVTGALVMGSLNGGVTWLLPVFKQPTGTRVTYVVMAPDFATSNEAYVGTSDGATTESAFQVSSDGGMSWNHAGLIDIPDTTPPTMEAIAEAQGQYYNTAPSFSNFGFDDNLALDDGWYQIDSYSGTWIALFTDAPGTPWDDDGWTIPGFATLSEGSHTIYFKASDDVGNVEGESGEWSWQFFKDTTPPTMEAIAEAQGQYYNTAPSFSNFGFDDNLALDDGWYQIDSYSGTWIALFTDAPGTSWDDDGWTIPGFDGLSEGSHTIYFKASDDVGNVEGESGEWSWQFFKDTIPPSDPIGVASTSHTPSVWSIDNTVDITWTDATDDTSGLDGYSILWDTNPTTIPDENKDIEEGVQATTSSALADGNSHYFHIRSVDNAGNWQSTVHLGPFFIFTPIEIVLPVVVSPGVIDLTPYLDPKGRTTVEIRLTSPDGLITIVIPRGTRTLDAEGNRLGSIEIIVLSTPPPPPGYALVGPAYDCRPDGATFEPAITLTFSYDPADIPTGVSEEDLVLAYWDGDKWVMLPTTINTVANTVTADVVHFTPFGILAKLPPAPAAFAVSTLTVSPAKVDIEERVTISLLVTNTGDLSGTYQVVLKIDNVAIATEDVTLAGGGSQTVTFTTAKDVAATYTVSINGLSGMFVVKPPPVPAAFATSNLTISPTEVDIRESVTIRVLVTNTGDLTGSYEVTLKINNVAVATKDVTLAGGASQTVTFATAKDVAGTYTVNVNGLSGTFTVKTTQVPAPAKAN